MKITTIGLDLAKNVFQVHGVNAEGNVTVQRRLRRKEVLLFFGGLEPCLVGLEACGSAHFWARELAALGHDVRIMPPSYVKAYVRRGKKNDAADAAAICEAVTRPNMRFVPIKTEVQQTALMLHKSRDLLIRQQNMLINAVRGHAAELGLVAAQGRGKVEDIIAAVEADDDDSLPTLARGALRPLVAQLRTNEKAIAELDAEIKAWHTQNEMSRRLATIPGVGVLTASAIAATVPDPSFFRSGREFAAWLGLVPRQNSSGGKERLGRISKQGNRYIRRMLVIGATGMLRYARAKSAAGAQWVTGLLERRAPRLVTVAMANKMARIAWAIMTRQETFRAPATAA
ncbi:IS110 family transposase [Mesorhizobium sp. PL10]